jgi:uncharacterized membrane protein
MLKIILVATTSLFLVGCNFYDSQKLQLEPKPVPGVETDNTGTEAEVEPIQADLLSYKIVMEKVLLKNCVGCHSETGRNRGKVNLETYEKVFQNKAAVRAEVFNKSMPPKPPRGNVLTEAQIKMVLDWIDNGARLEPNTPPPVVEPLPVVEPAPVEPPPVVAPITSPVATSTPVVAPTDPVVAPTEPIVQPVTAIYFADVMEKVLKTNCLKCHSEAGRNRGKVNLETYANVIDVQDDLLTDLETDQMPPSPPKGIPLTDEQKKLIFDWFAAGAPEKAP